MTTYAQATEIQSLSPNTYSAVFPHDWCMGLVPQGGYVTACILRVANIHFLTTLSAQNQPHTISLQLSFLRRTAVGPAKFTVQAVKLGRATSVVHISLTQGGPENQAPLVVGYLTHSNLVTESGISLRTHHKLFPPPYSLASTAALKLGTDENWIIQPKPAFHKFRKALHRVQIYVPRKTTVAPATVDEWICFSNGERFTQESLGFVCDTFPLITAGFEPEEVQSQLHFLDLDTGNLKNKPNQDVPSSSSSPTSPPPASSPSKTHSEIAVGFWLPTLVINLELKKLLPPEGVDWLFVRCRAKQIKNGRMDLDIVIMDEDGELVAVSSHVALIVSSERQLGSKAAGGKEAKSRL